MLIQLSDMSSFAISNKPMLVVIISNMMKSLGDVFLGFEGMPFTNQSGTISMLFQHWVQGLQPGHSLIEHGQTS